MLLGAVRKPNLRHRLGVITDDCLHLREMNIARFANICWTHELARGLSASVDRSTQQVCKGLQFEQVPWQMALPKSKLHAIACLPPCGHGQCCTAPWRSMRLLCLRAGPSGNVLMDLADKMQSSATTLLGDFEQQRDFSRAIASSVSKITGSKSRPPGMVRSQLRQKQSTLPLTIILLMLAQRLNPQRLVGDAGFTRRAFAYSLARST